MYDIGGEFGMVEEIVESDAKLSGTLCNLTSDEVGEDCNSVTTFFKSSRKFIDVYS